MVNLEPPAPLGHGLRIGILSFAHVHAPGLAALLVGLGAEVLVSDPDVDRGRAGAEAAGATFVGSHADLLGAGVDGVVICSENVHHRELTEQAATAGAWVLTEKPLALSLSDGAAMINACKRAKVGLMTAFPMRFVPQLSQVAALAHGGSLGQVVSMAGTNPGTCPGGWFVDPELSGGGSVIDHTVHLADLMCWLTGATPTSVYAQVNDLITPEYGVETGGLVAVTFSDGTIGTIDASWSRLPHYPVWGGLTLEVVGTEGILSADPFGEQMLTSTDRTRWLRFGADPVRAMLVEFLTSIRERRNPSPSGRDGLLSTAIALAAYRSAAEHTVVDVELA